MRGMFRPFGFLAALALALAAAPAAAEPECLACMDGKSGANDVHPLEIEISSGLKFSRMALSGPTGGSAVIDPQTGAKQTSGALIDLGGFSVQGRAHITGEPMRAVRITMPSRVVMTSSTGQSAELANFSTSLSAFPTLDATGALEFTFGAELRVNGSQGGNFRGRIPISVDYN